MAIEENPESSGDEKWNSEEDAKVLQKVAEIMSEPARHSKAQAVLKQMMANMKAGHALGKKMRTGKQAEFERMREKQGAKKF